MIEFDNIRKMLIDYLSADVTAMDGPMHEKYIGCVMDMLLIYRGSHIEKEDK